MLFSSKKETEDDITRRVKRRVERYVDQLRVQQNVMRQASRGNPDPHTHPETAPEFDDDAPTLVLSVRSQSQLPANASGEAHSPSLGQVSQATIVPVLAASAAGSGVQERKSDLLVRFSKGSNEPAKTQSLKIISGSQRPVEVFPEDESEELNNFGMASDSGFSEHHTDSSSEKTKFNEESLDLNRFAEVSRYVLAEKKSKKVPVMQNLATKQPESDIPLENTEHPALFMSSRSTIVVFASIGIALIVLLYFVLTFEKYVY